MHKLTVFFFIMMLIIGGTVSAQEEDDDLDELARYSIDEAGNLSLMSGTADPTHDDLWILMLVLLPTDYVDSYLYEFAVFESEDTLAYVSELEEDVWELAINIDEDPERALTVIHEFGHILALNNTQFDTYPTEILARESDLSDEDYSEGIEADMALCTTTAFDDGCPIEDSYIALFTQEFWDADDVEQIYYMEIDDPAAYFFDLNPDAFVSEYAATNPNEDFAESFSYFVGLSEDDYPLDGDSYLMDAKILWFEQFPELIEMKEAIREAAEANGIEFEFGEDSNFF
jgi:hypothetical protein